MKSWVKTSNLKKTELCREDLRSPWLRKWIIEFDRKAKPYSPHWNTVSLRTSNVHVTVKRIRRSVCAEASILIPSLHDWKVMNMLIKLRRYMNDVRLNWSFTLPEEASAKAVEASKNTLRNGSRSVPAWFNTKASDLDLPSLWYTVVFLLPWSVKDQS
jgi:hypothetical protein